MPQCPPLPSNLPLPQVRSRLGASGSGAVGSSGLGSAQPQPPPAVWAEQLGELAEMQRDGCLRLARELALGFGRFGGPAAHVWSAVCVACYAIALMAICARRLLHMLVLANASACDGLRMGVLAC